VRVEELLHVKDLTPEAFFGPTAAPTATTPVGEPSSGASAASEPGPRNPGSGETEAGAITPAPIQLAGLLTVYGTGRVNVNDAPATVLRALPGLFESRARDQIVKTILEKRPFRDLTELASVLAPLDGAAYTRASPLVALRSDFFRVKATARRGVRARVVEAVVQRRGRALSTLFYRED
jgi:type II secretory pathway component PulK